MTCTAAASDSSRRLRSAATSLGGLGDPVAQPLDQRGQAEVPGDRGGVQRLADVPQVGEQPLAVGAGRAAGRAARCRW